MTVGYMTMPADFRYKDVFLQGKPKTPARHPAMNIGHRAKIFAPFAALRGFDQAVLSKDVLYTDRIQLDEEEMEELNRRLRILRDLTANGRLAQRNRPVCAITYFVPCADKNNPAYGYRGQYKTLTDIVWNIDPVRRTVLVGKTQIPMRFILSIESNSLFDNGWELIAP